MNWLTALWAQYFRRERTMPFGWFINANFTLGCLFSIALLVVSQESGAWSVLTLALIGMMVISHVLGLPLSKIQPARSRIVLLVQGITLALTVIVMIVSTSLDIVREPVLKNIRYLPGLSVSLLTYAGLEVEFGMPSPHTSWRRIGLGLGLAGEVLLMSCLVWHFTRA